MQETSQTIRTRWLHELRWPEIENYLANDDVVLVPIGATEQHGRHLPLLVDTGWAIAACEDACHMGYAGSITLGADTLRQVAVDVCQSLIHHGFHHVIIINGNRIANLQPLEIAAVQLQNATGARVAVADAGLIAHKEIAALCEADDGGLDHAGEAESAFALNWAGQHVDMEQAHASAPNEHSSSVFDYPIELDPALNGNAVSRFTTPAQHRAATLPDGHVGDPRPATTEKGRQMAQVIGANLAIFIEEFRLTETGDVQSTIPM